ncbi:MAG: glutamyl-tRNA reductase [Bradymonadia bacterium]|jgi:glutamyl-tRNA reductase
MITVLGLSHKTAPVQLREQFAIADDALPSIAERARLAGCREAVIISTCNRVEIYATLEPNTPPSRLAEVLRSETGLALQVDEHVYQHEGEAAIRHLFRVASSLDSMVVGEPQILGQLKAAFEACRALSLTGPLLSRAVERAFSVAKRVRTETGIARSVVSISSVAVDLARQIFGKLDGRTAVLVGAGEMGELAARHLLQAGVSELLVANRSVESAVKLASTLGGNPRGLDELPRLLVEADIVITSTGARTFLVERKMMAKALKARKYRPIFLIDIAVPRNIDPSLHTLDNVFVYDVDDLQSIAEENLEGRLREAHLAEQLVDAEAQKFFASQSAARSVTPTILALRKRVSGLRASEFERAGATLASLDKRQRRSVERLVDGVLNKLMHDVMQGLKTGDQSTLEAAQHLFKLKPRDPNDLNNSESD